MTWLIVVIAVVVVLAAAAAYKWSQSASLRQRYGPEYERILALEGGDQRRADAALRERAKRRAALDIRELDPVVHARFRERWYAVQGHFVDDPRAAVNEASGLARAVMRERGYEGEDPTFADGPDSRVYDELDFVAVDHPEATTRFREAFEVERNGSASTEELRQAFQGYKTLFEAVLVVRGDVDDTVVDGTAAGAVSAGPARPRIRDRVLDLRRRHDDTDGDADRSTGAGAGASTGAGEATSGGFLARLRRQPAEHDSR